MAKKTTKKKTTKKKVTKQEEKTASKKVVKKTTKKKTAKKATEATKASPADSRLIEVGRAAPAFKLSDQDGKTHQLKDLRGQWVVLYFYPKDNTSGCTKQACQFRDAQPKFKGIDAVVLGVSPDDERSHARFRDKFDLTFDLLADPDKIVCVKYGVWQQKSMYGRKYMGVVRTTYLIDPKGKVAHRWDKVKVADHAADVMDVLKNKA